MHKCDCGPASLCTYPKCSEGIPLLTTPIIPTVTITKREYEDLLEDSKILQRLEDAGVDNWEGYHYTFPL